MPHPARRWFTFAALSLAYFVVSAGAFSSLGVVLPSMVQEMHWSWEQAGLGYTLLGVACGLASFLPAVLIRLFGVRGSMAVGMLSMVCGFGAMALTHSIWLYLAATVMIGFAFSLVSTVPGTHVLTDLFERRSTALGAYFTIGAAGGNAGPLFFIAVQSVTHGWRSYWIGFVIISVVVGVFAIATTPGKRDETAHVAEAPEVAGPVEMVEGLKDWTVRHALATPQFYLIVAGYTVYLLVNTTTHGFAVKHLTERGVAPAMAATMLSLEAFVGAAVGLIGGVLGEKVPAKTLMIVSLVAVTIGAFALAEARGWPLMMLYVLGVGTGFGLSFLSSTLLLLQYFGRKANLELFSIMCMLSTTAALGPLLGGWARDVLGNFWAVLMVHAAITGSILIACLFLRAPTLRPIAELQPAGEPAL
jgi:MFS family permease